MNILTLGRKISHFVNGGAECRITEAFQWFSFLFPIEIKANRRHQRDTVGSHIKNHVSEIIQNKNNVLRVIRDEILNQKSSLLVPPKNFLLPDAGNGQENAGEWLLKFQQGSVSLQQLNKKISKKIFLRDALPIYFNNVYKSSSKKRVYAFVDDRNLVFPIPPTHAHHGRSRDTGNNRHFLNGRYRFGVPIADGFHFDVQYEKQRSLHGIVLECAVHGAIELDRNDAYVNVYPNDFVNRHKKE